MTEAGERLADDRPKFVCDWPGCDKSYIRHEHLTRHQLNHKGFSLKCEICDKQFTRNDLLQRHLTRHERNEEDVDVPRKRLKPTRSGSDASVLRDADLTPLDRKQSRAVEDDSTELSAGYPSIALTGYTAVAAVPADNSYSNIRSFPSPSPSIHQTTYSHSSANLPHQLHRYSASGGSPYDQQSPSTTSNLTQSGTPFPVRYNTPSFSPQFYDSSRLPVESNLDTDYGWLFSNVNNGNGLFEEPLEFQNFIDLQSDVLSQYTDNSLDGPGLLNNYQISPFTHATLLSKLPQELHGQPFLQIGRLRETLENALDSFDLVAPMFHRPTFKANHVSMPLLLALISYGFMTNVSRPDLYSTGLQIHQITRRILFDPDVNPSGVDLMFLQAMLVHEISGTFLGSRIEHEKSDVLHGQLVTLARRSSFLVQDSAIPSTHQNSKLRAEERWHEWIRRETTKRLAHFIFCNDVQQHTLYNHTRLMAVEDMKLAMPCDKQLWNASLSQWSALQRQNHGYERDARRFHRDLVMAFVVEDHTMINSAKLDALHHYVIIHGLLNLISMHSERKGGPVTFNQQTGSRSTPYNAQAERLILSNALNKFESAIDRATRVDAPETIDITDVFARNARVILQFAKVGLQIYGPDMEVCAGAIFSGGRAVNSERVEQSWRRMTERHLALETTFPALDNIQRLCSAVRQPDGSVRYGGVKHDIFAQTLGSEMILPSCLYNAALTIWTYSVAVQREAGRPLDINYGRYDPQVYREHLQNMANGPVEVAKLCQDFRDRSPDDLAALKVMVTKLMVLVSERMASSRSGIANENRSVISSLCN